MVRTTPTGAFPQAVAVDDATDRVFVANRGDDTVSMLDAGTGRALRLAQLSMRPDTLLIAPSLGVLFIASAQDQRHIAVLDARRGVLLRTIALRGPTEPNVPPPLAFDPRTRHLFVAMGAQVRMLDAQTGHLLHIARLDSAVTALAADDQDALCLAITAGALDAARRFTSPGSLVALDARTGAVRHRVAVGVGPIDIGLDSQHHRALVVNSNVNPNGTLAAPLPTTNWWAQHMPWLRGPVPSPAHAQDGHGTVTVVDTSRL
jgi:DNA-binding beta-propeller fold protein YncE